MEESNMSLTLLLTLTSLCAGVYLGAVRGKLLIIYKKNYLHILYYIFSAFVVSSSIGISIYYYDEIINNTLAKSLVVILFLLGVSLIFFTYKYLTKKFIYKATKLDPIVNAFTSKADKDDIMLFGGDLNFFGNSTTEIDNNSQYTHLKSLNFNKISILCYKPNVQNDKIRYGKLLSELTNVELRYYQPTRADLKVRGRIITVNGVEKLLMYNKTDTTGYYQAIETDTANSNGALYINIWGLVWQLATRPSATEVDSFKKLYNGN